MIYQFTALSDLWAFVEMILEDEGSCSFDASALTVSNVEGMSDATQDWIAMDMAAENCKLIG